mmetsp:Transcript_2939/g.18458  ORF Transcript_2939/g.18458 Transcript_2939/m.18458 type:complete len:357 (+) Transcript_2939:4709-5779(+)
MLGVTWALWLQVTVLDRFVHCFFCHPAICCPLASRNRNDPLWILDDDVITGYTCRVLRIWVSGQWTYAAPGREHVRTPHLDIEVVFDGIQDKPNFFVGGSGLHGQISSRVRSSCQRMVKPGKHEHHPSIFGLWNNQTHGIWRVVIWKDNMHTSTRLDDGLLGLVRQLADPIHKRSRCIDDNFRRGFKDIIGYLVLQQGPLNHTLVVFGESHDLCVVGHGCPLFLCTQGDGQAELGIVHLSIVVHDGPFELFPIVSLCRQGGKHSPGFVCRDKPGHGEPFSTRHKIVGFESCPVVGDLPPLVARRHDGNGIREVWSIVHERKSFVQGFEHKLELSIVQLKHGFFQVPHTSVDKLGGS